jgi:hypothetical protein
MQIKLRGGVRDGEVLQVSDSTNVLSVPLLSVRDNKAIDIHYDGVKRHSWDDDALNIKYVDYYRTALEAEDGTVIFSPKAE